MDTPSRTYLYVNPTNAAIALTHQYSDGTVHVAETSPQTFKKPRAGAADLLLFRHLMLENPDTDTANLPGIPTPVPVQTRRINNGQNPTPEGMEQAGWIDDYTLNLQYTKLRRWHRTYLGVLETMPADQPRQLTEILAYTDATIQLVKRMNNGIHIVEPNNSSPTGMDDALRFHGDYEALLTEQKTDDPYPFPFEISVPIGIFTTQRLHKSQRRRPNHRLRNRPGTGHQPERRLATRTSVHEPPPQMMRRTHLRLKRHPNNGDTRKDAQHK